MGVGCRRLISKNLKICVSYICDHNVDYSRVHLPQRFNYFDWLPSVRGFLEGGSVLSDGAKK